MNASQARELAVETVEHADYLGHAVAETIVVGKAANGYFVADNGEEVSGLTKEQAIEIIVENLAKPQVAIVEFDGDETGAMSLFPYQEDQYSEYDDATTGRIYLAGHDELTAAQENYLRFNNHIVRYEVVDAE